MHECCSFQKKVVILQQKLNIESPIMDSSAPLGTAEYLTADELMQRIEPRIRAMFR